VPWDTYPLPGTLSLISGQLKAVQYYSSFFPLWSRTMERFLEGVSLPLASCKSPRQFQPCVPCCSPAIELQVRSALLHIDRLSFSRPQSVTSLPVPFGFTAPALDPPSSTDQFKHTTFDKETPIATYHLRSSALDQLQSLLIAGERRQACHYALEQKMWAHAMLIASSLDKDAWKDATNEFIRSELGVQTTAAASLRSDGANSQSVSNGRESLRVAYSLFSGQGTTSSMHYFDTCSYESLI
jgi:Sec23-binding domain of Sec16